MSCLCETFGSLLFSLDTLHLKRSWSETAFKNSAIIGLPCGLKILPSLQLLLKWWKLTANWDRSKGSTSPGLATPASMLGVSCVHTNDTTTTRKMFFISPPSKHCCADWTFKQRETDREERREKKRLQILPRRSAESRTCRLSLRKTMSDSVSKPTWADHLRLTSRMSNMSRSSAPVARLQILNFCGDLLLQLPVLLVAVLQEHELSFMKFKLQTAKRDWNGQGKRARRLKSGIHEKQKYGTPWSKFLPWSWYSTQRWPQAWAVKRRMMSSVKWLLEDRRLKKTAMFTSVI